MGEVSTSGRKSILRRRVIKNHKQAAGRYSGPLVDEMHMGPCSCDCKCRLRHIFMTVSHQD